MVKKEVEEWFSRAEKDFEEAKFLFNHNRPLEYTAFFLHQAVEKYLKGFLINNGWELEKTHDLVKLIRDATQFDKSFENFIPSTPSIPPFLKGVGGLGKGENRYRRVLHQLDALRQAIKRGSLVSKLLNSYRGRSQCSLR